MYEDQMNPAFAGMKADAGFDRVESYPVAADGLVYGVVVGRDAYAARHAEHELRNYRQFLARLEQAA